MKQVAQAVASAAHALFSLVASACVTLYECLLLPPYTREGLFALRDERLAETENRQGVEAQSSTFLLSLFPVNRPRPSPPELYAQLNGKSEECFRHTRDSMTNQPLFTPTANLNRALGRLYKDLAAALLPYCPGE
jgi:hypothetical protein